jgi:putative SOS response-associated peptidase YedK
MCYSALVQQNAKKLARMMGARVDVESYADLFDRRAKGERLYINKGMEIPFLKDPKTPDEKAIGRKLRAWHESEIERITKEKAAQELRLQNAEESLKKKETKKAQEDIRIATNKISKFEHDLKRHGSMELKSDSESRIFPFHFVSMLVLDEKGEKVIRPFRYHMRPNGEDESFDFKRGGCYNARLDSLSTVPFWRDSMGKRHGIIVVHKFYENVPTEKYLKHNKLKAADKEKENIVVCFEPEGVEHMFIPTIWDCWKKKGASPLYSTALITDEPAPEVSKAGHDRTPIFLKESMIDAWLTAKGPTKEIINTILSERETPYYAHVVHGAAA